MAPDGSCSGPTGYAWTIVNGEVFMEDGEHTGALAGRPLREV